MKSGNIEKEQEKKGKKKGKIININGEEIEVSEIFFGQRVVSKCEGFQTIRGLNPSPSSGCAGGLLEPETLPSDPENGDVVPETSENLHILTRISAR